ncbi:MAG: O-antigen ligase family protein [Bacteroidetes bacterium]|nr:O-antigen ligase family protein [Bacteroidota bacterium]
MKTAAIILLSAGIIRAITNPLYGLVILWLALWLYPNTLLFGTLPANIRFDDLLLLALFIIAIIKKKHQFNWLSSSVFRLATCWWLVCVLGSISGLIYSNWGSTGDVVKFLIKALYIPMTVVILLAFVDNTNSLKLLLHSLLIAGALAALLGIGTVLFPDAFSDFLIPNNPSELSVLEDLDASTELERRATGAIGIVSTSILCPFTALLGITLFGKAFRKIISPLLSVLATIIAITGLVFTQSRGPLIGFLTASSLLIFVLNFRGSNLYKFAFIIVFIIVLSTDNSLKVLLMNRFIGSTGSTFDGGVKKREQIWHMFADKFDAALVINGVGFIPCQRIYGIDVHNTYIGSLIYGGIFGVVLLLFILYEFIRRSRQHLKSSSRLENEWSSFLICLCIFLLIIGMSIEAFQQIFCMQLVFVAFTISEILSNRATVVSINKSKINADV